jgi:hypothetical protein
VSRAAASASACGSGRGRPIRHTRVANSSSGQSAASTAVSCGSASVTAPVSAGSVSTRMAASSAAGSCSGRQIRSKQRDTGRRQSLTETSRLRGSSSSCSTGLAGRVANTSPGSSSTGSRLTVASAAPVTMFVAPGPIEEVQANACSRSFIRA